MKHLTPLFVLLLLFGSVEARPNQQIKPEKKTFFVSHVQNPARPETREKLIELYEAVREKYTVNEKDELIPIAEAKPANAMTIRGTIVQSLGANDYMVSRGRSDQVHIHTVSGRVYADKDVIVVDARPTGFFDYKTVLGASARVRSYQEILFTPVTRETFTEALRTGTILTITLEEERDCLRCRGRGTVRGRAERGQHPDQMYRCPICPEQRRSPADPFAPLAKTSPGKILVPVEYTVQW